MNNTVTFETAARLKEAGFPQPEPQPGQFWYRQSGQLLFVQYLHGYGAQMVVVDLPKEVDWHFVAFEHLTFAPTATDIMEHLPKKMLYKEKNGEFVIGEYYWDEFMVLASNANPHEAAAAAYLEIKKQLNEVRTKRRKNG